MKIACIGNMNNMLFVFMKHLRDRGVEADLFVFDNEYEHFLPNNDTEYDKYKKFVKYLNWGSPKSFFFVKKEIILKDCLGYDLYIGSGFTPAFFEKVGLKLDFFAQYGADLYTLPFQKISFKPKAFLLWIISKFQKNGILSSRYIINEIESEYLTSALKKLNRDYITLRRPLVHSTKITKTNEYLVKILTNLRLKNDLIFFSQSRHLWNKNKIKNKEDKFLKGNDIFIEALGKYIKSTNKSIKVIFIEYGEDVFDSKLLIKNLGIEENIIWLKKMSREEIFYIIKNVDLVVDQFLAEDIGCSGWEAIASGKNLLAYINKSNYKEKDLINIPPLLNANKEEEIFEILLNFEEIKFDEFFIKEWYQTFLNRIMDNWIKIFNQNYETLQLKVKDKS